MGTDIGYDFVTKKSAVKAVLFDLDGTLLDSFSGHFATYEIMFARFGIEITKERFISSYSPNWYQTYKAFGLSKEHWDAADSLWLAEADKHLPVLLPGVGDVLAMLKKTYRLGIVTSGSRSRVEKDIHRLDIHGHFKTIVTGDDVREPKPSPESLVLALENLSISPKDTVYVGDALADFEMARAAGVSFFGVPSEFANLTHGHSEYDVRPITALPDVLNLTRDVDGNSYSKFKLFR